MSENPGAQSEHRRYNSGSFVDEEKYPPPRQPNHTWRDRVLGAGAGLAAFEGVKRLFNRRRDQDEEVNVGGYSRPPMGDNSSISHTDVSRVQSGHAPFSPADRHRVGPGRPERVTEIESPMSSPTRPIRTPGRTRLRPRRSGSFSSVSSIDSIDSPAAKRPAGGITRGQGLMAGIAGFTGLAFLREKQKQRRERKEERRAQELRHDEEDIADRVNRTQRHRPGFGESVVDDRETVHETLGTTSPESSRHHAPHSVTDDAYSSVTRRSAQPGYPVDDTSIPIPTGPGPAATARFPEANTSRVRFEDKIAPAAAGAATGLAAGVLADEAARRRHEQRSSSARRGGGSSSTSGEPPVSVKVKIHDDNRHVTLRRLNEQEAAAEREARRQERRARRRPRTESLNSQLESDTGDAAAGYRRRMDRPPTGAAAVSAPFKNIPVPASPIRNTEVPIQHAAPPPVPMHSSPAGAGMSSPPMSHPATSMAGYDTTTGTGTEMSAFEDNRRRRRAERAAAKQPGGPGRRGEYE
ncbi:hypothetical protein ANO11243_013890 [Dothideomycetidae sp. 11243]|nr:hypothetical protein ANO11243_013890 [fungal sp. No.11243]